MDKRVKTATTLVGAIFLSLWLGRAGIPTLPVALHTVADTVVPLQGTPTAPTATAKERIYIENVDLWSYDKELNPDAQILKGNVQFRHHNARMYCDSAYLYEATNRFEAFGNVHINQGDSVQIYCDYLDYDGVTMLARLRDNVRMEHRQTTLFTDSLDYDRVSGVGYYFDKGVIADTLNTLSSLYGDYSTVTRKAVFQQDVKLENPNFTLYSDTLEYDTQTKIATILGPTQIVSDSGRIEATRGMYDTERDRSYLMDRAEVYSADRFLTGDSIYYDRQGKFAQLFGEVIMRDTLQKTELRGNYAEYHEDTQYGVAKDSAYIVEYSSADTLYAHAQLFEMVKKDSVNYYQGKGNVRLFRNDVQAVCDSIVFNTRDSVTKCIGKPFVWSPPSQITGDTIVVYTKNGKPWYAHVYENAFSGQQVDSTHFQQMRGSEIFAYFGNNSVDSVRTSGNAETIYYDVDKDSVPVSQIRTQSSAILMAFENQELVKVKLLDKTTGKMTPIELVAPEDLYYPSFVWFAEGRPTSRTDIFRKTPKPGRAKGEESVPPEQAVTGNDPVPEPEQAASSEPPPSGTNPVTPPPTTPESN